MGPRGCIPTRGMRHAEWICGFRFGGVMRNTLHYGDCLNVMADFPDKCVDLIYLDPPFNSKTNYNLLFPNPDSGQKTKSDQPHLAQIIAFHDTWTWDGPAAERVKRIEHAVAHPAHKAIKGLNVMLGESGSMAYLSYMAERLGEMKRLLKPTGSIYLHCDPTMSHYLKALMDEVFGYQNFRNEIVWKRFGSHNDAKKGFGNIHDVLLFYAGGPKTKFQKTYQPYSKEYIKNAYPYKDKRGRYGTSPLQARSLSGGGYEYTYKGVSDIWKFPKERLEELDRDGYIHWPKNGKIPRRKVYLHLMKGAPTQDVITDIKPLSSSHKERLGYPTQKPISLLERIIEASSNPGDIVLDPFCGCGTAIEAAYKLGRSWLGIDISPFAIDLIQKVRMKGISIEVRGVPEDMAGAKKLASERPFEFEKWSISRIPGLAPNSKQRGDGGIDGRGLLLNEPDDHDSKLVLAQTKGGKFNASNLRDFMGVIERDRAAIGVYITLNSVTSNNAHTEAIRKGTITYGASRYPRAQLWSIHDYFNGRQPNIPPLADPYTGKAMQQSLF